MSLVSSLKLLVDRIANEFKLYEKRENKAKPGGYASLDDRGKVPIDQIDVAAIISPVGTIEWANKSLKPKMAIQFTMSFSVQNWNAFDKVVLRSEDGAITVTPTSHVFNPAVNEILASFTCSTATKYNVVVTRYGVLYAPQSINVSVQQK